MDAAVAAQCDNDTPWLAYDIDANGLGDEATVRFTNAGGTAEYRVPAGSGRLLWPGAVLDSAGNPIDWPGWDQDADGTWFLNPDNPYMWARHPCRSPSRSERLSPAPPRSSPLPARRVRPGDRRVPAGRADLHGEPVDGGNRHHHDTAAADFDDGRRLRVARNAALHGFLHAAPRLHRRRRHSARLATGRTRSAPEELSPDATLLARGPGGSVSGRS